MSKHETMTVTQQDLVDAWRKVLPSLLNASDEAKVEADDQIASGLRVHIQTEGRTGYSFDFACHYVDNREIKVELVDVEKNGRSVDEHTEIIQTLVEDYVRHLHECAQALKKITNP